MIEIHSARWKRESSAPSQQHRQHRQAEMAGIGNGYDLSNSTFSPDGRIFQVEYAVKAVENAGTIIGIRCTDGVILAQEKLVTSKLLVKHANKRLGQVQRHIGVASTGMIPDGRHFLNRARDEAESWTDVYKVAIQTKALADRMGGYVQAHTLYSSVRPFALTALLAGVDAEDGPQLFMVEPSGQYWGYRAAAAGKGRQVARNELEKLDFETLSVDDAVKDAARIIYIAHEDSKDKDFEMEMGWIKDGKWQVVPADIQLSAEQDAKKFVEGQTEEMEE